MLDLVWLIPALPLAGFLFLVAFGRRLGEPLAGWVGTVTVAGSFVVACVVFGGLVDRPPDGRYFSQTLFSWIPVGSFRVDVGFFVDPLAMTMVLFITGIAALIHLYSIGYMHGDEKFSKFFIYLNLFVFSMLMLVLGDNLLITFLGWEGVGLCSYFLISFWFTDPANASAGKKAFVTNRVGDWGFMVAIFLTFATIGSIRYVDIIGAAKAGEIAAVTATAITLLLLVGAVGKSAQIPLFVWLPDAMAGPTPVSALIHAATMVTAGVYLLTRMSPVLFASYSWAPDIIAWVGALTALFAAAAAIAQNDIKKVLAYSTISQLGYMFLAVGVGGYVAGIFHMITHAFFKALLFLAAGSVIHGMHHEQDMRRYGGLYKLLPVTCGVFIVGWLAIAGVPPFSGFWSKDEILAYAWNSNKLLWFVGLVAALLTAFYMSREVFMTFFGRYRYADPTPAELNEAWDAKIAAAADAVDEATSSLSAARADAETAKGKVAAAEEAFVKAQATVEAARPAAASITVAELQAAQGRLEAAGDDKDARKAAQGALRELEKPGKDLEKAQSALSKASDGRGSAASALATSEAKVETVLATLSVARREVDVVEGEAARRRPADTLVSLTEPPSVDGVEDSLPPAVAQRREFHPHESPWTMIVPLIVLSLGAIFAGVINLPFGRNTRLLERWLEPSLFGDETHLAVSGLVQVLLATVAVLIGLLGIAVGAHFYLKARGNRAVVEQPAFAHAWYVDETYAAVAGGPGRVAFEDTASFDRVVVDGSVNGVGRVVRWFGALLRRAQNGYVRSYALGVAVGAVLLVGLILTKASF